MLRRVVHLPATTRFTVGPPFVRHGIINNVPECGGISGYTWGTCQPALHPFHWPTMRNLCYSRAGYSRVTTGFKAFPVLFWTVLCSELILTVRPVLLKEAHIQGVIPPF